MKLSSYLDPALIFVNINAATKEDAITMLIERAATVDSTFARLKAPITAAIMEREQSISTALGNGLAVPHARVENYNDVIVVIGVLNQAIQCELATKETGSVQLIVMVVVGKTQNQLMLQLMSGVTKLVERQDLVEAIVGNPDPDKVYAHIKKAGIQLKKEFRAGDLMNTDLHPARIENTLEEIAGRLVAENRVGLPVVANDGTFLGEITERELIQYGLPKYATVMNNLRFVTTGEPFEAYFQHESQVTVQELYRRDPVTIDKNASLMEISLTMVGQGNTRLYVVENTRYLGMITRSDLIKKVLHI